MRHTTERCVVHGAERLCVLQYSASYATEQAQSVSSGLTKAMAKLRALERELARPQARPQSEKRVRQRVQKALGRNYVPDLVTYELRARGNAWDLRFDVDMIQFQRLLGERFGRTVLVTNRDGWSAAEVVEAYGRQQHVERVFRGLKGGGWLGWSPAYHWTDSKLQVHGFYCMLGVSLLQYLHRRAQAVWPGLTLEGLRAELQQVQQIELLYANEREGAPPHVTTVASSQSLAQTGLVAALGLEGLIPEPAAKGAG